MCDVWSDVSRISSTFNNNVFVLVTVQQFKCFPNLNTTREQNQQFTHVLSFKYLDVSSIHAEAALQQHYTDTSRNSFTLTVSNEALSRITTSLLSDIRSWRLRRCLAGLGSYSSKCSKPRFFPSGAAMMQSLSVACCLRHSY